MFIAILTLLSALSISGVAIFYSVIGLATIFPGAFVPVVIMASVLEVGKLITASWLYRHWKHTRFLLKFYLTTAVIILSLITSMGIFGFLSKAHLEQNLASENLTQRIEIINSKIVSQETYIKRQNAVIERAEKNLTRTTGSNTEAIEIEKQNLKDAQDKLKTLLVVETNTIKDLNSRLSILDNDVKAYTDRNKGFGGANRVKKGVALREAQKPERNAINEKIDLAQSRIQSLKDDYKNETNAIQKRIEQLREGSVNDKSDVYIQIEVAEGNILKAHNSIDDLVIDRGPLETEMIKIEAEVGPVKYIAALVIDWGVTNDVDLNEAVRWVILIIIMVFDPLAVALLLAANQSLMRRFPVEPPPPPPEIADLEKPDPYEPPIKDKTNDLNDMVAKANALAEKERMEKIQKDWEVKLYEFNKERLAIKQDEEQKQTVIAPAIQETIPHIDLKGQKKTEDKEIVVDNDDGFDEDQIKYDIETKTKAEQEEEFKQREEEERQALEEYARKAIEEDEQKTTTVTEALKITEAESVETPIQEKDNRIKPDFTEVIEPEVALGDGTTKKGTLGKKINPLFKKPKVKVIEPETMTDFERTGMLNKFHQEHGKYEDISDEALKKERDDANKAQFLADVGITEEDARNHPPMTTSRKAFFQDHIDDVLRGNSTSENLPPDIAKTVAVLLSEYNDPDIITKGSALKPEGDKNVETMTQDALKEKFMEQPETEERPITDKELDYLLEGFPERPKANEDYVQNEEQTDETLWQKTKELDLPEPEKNEIILPELKSVTEEIPELVEKINIENVIPQDKFTRYKKRIATDEEYHQRIEQRINELITKLENGEIKLNDLTINDEKVILDILNQNG